MCQAIGMRLPAVEDLIIGWVSEQYYENFTPTQFAKNIYEISNGYLSGSYLSNSYDSCTIYGWHMSDINTISTSTSSIKDHGANDLLCVE